MFKVTLLQLDLNDTNAQEFSKFEQKYRERKESQQQAREADSQQKPLITQHRHFKNTSTIILVAT